jgi:hypothetical protein
VLLGVLAGTVAGIARELLVGGNHRDRLRLRVLRRRRLEEPFREGRLGVRAGRNHGEEFRVLELAVHGEAEQDDEDLPLLDHDRHGGGGRHGGIRTDHQVDLVDVHQLRIDARHRRRLALVVVEDELDRAPEQPALGIDLLFPDLHADQRLLAVRRQRAGQRHREADLDRLALLGGSRNRRQRQSRKGRG